MLDIKTRAPHFELLDFKNKLVKLSDFLGKKVVVYFYPKDNTPGCTRQACAFRDAFDGFKKKNVTIIGISKDSQISHQKFITEYDLPFILLSDPNLETIKAYEVWVKKVMYGKETMGVSRSTYILDEKGFIEKVFEKANPDTNAADILAYLDN